MTTDKTIKSKNQPKQTNVTWIDLSGETPIEKHFINGRWIAVSGGGSSIDISGKADKATNATNGNFAGLDANGNLNDSGKKASDFATAAQGAKADTAYQKPSSGIPESDLSSDVRQALQKHFKGWYASSSSLPANPVVGDYAYVKGATATDPAAIYECTTAGSWSDSERTADTSNVQTFASGEKVNETAIKDNLDSGGESDSTNILSAKQGYLLNDAIMVADNKKYEPTYISGLYVGDTKVKSNQNRGLYYVKIFAGETIIAKFKFTENYVEAGITETIPAADVVTINYEAGGTGKRQITFTAGTDGYCCVSFWTPSSVESIEFIKEVNAIGKDVYTLQKNVATLMENPKIVSLTGLGMNLTNDISFSVTPNTRYKLEFPTYRYELPGGGSGGGNALINIKYSDDGTQYGDSIVYVRCDAIAPKYIFITTGNSTKYVKVIMRLPSDETIQIKIYKCDSFGVFDFNDKQTIDASLYNMMKYPDNGVKPLILLHCSDIHSFSDSLQRIVDFRDTMFTAIDDIIHTGDNVGETASATSFDFWDDIDGSEKILNVIGNHDFLYASGFTPSSTFEYDTYLSPYIANWDVTQPDGASANNRCYYYKDYIANGIRLVVLDIRLEDKRSTLSEEADLQVSWLESVLADAIEEELGVIIACHYTPAFQDNFNTGFNTNTEFYPMGTNASSYWTNAVDSFITNGGDFICWLTGHNHKDFCGVFTKSGSSNKQVCICVDCAAVRNDSSVRYRGYNSKSQDAFNVLSINKNTKTISVLRIGNDKNFMLRSIDSMSIKYDSAELIYG